MPTKDFNVGGSCPTGRLRVRPTWFGLCVVEELIENRDGSHQWQRIWYSRELANVKEREGVE